MNPTLNITEMERSMLRAYFLTDYGDGPGTDTWSHDVINYSGIPGNKARGVMSSLVKKGLIYIRPGSGSSEDASTYLTPAGILLCEQAGITARRCESTR